MTKTETKAAAAKTATTIRTGVSAVGTNDRD
jgi:hypothetical protein